MNHLLNRWFNLAGLNTSIRQESIAGISTFLTMSYIIFVNPSILKATGMDTGSLFVATCLAAAIGTLIMGLWANAPIAMAPGMGLNAFFAFTLVIGMKMPWQTALGAVFISGMIFVLLSATGARRWLIDGIPESIRTAITTGIGLFLILIALRNSGIVINDEHTSVALGKMNSVPALLCLLGLLIIVVLDFYRIKAAILISILSITALSMALGDNHFTGIMSMPPSIAPSFFKLDIMGALSFGFFHLIIVMILVEVFDATGTLMGVLKRAGLLNNTPESDKRLNRALMADSAAIVAGSFLGTSSTTAYIESAAGVEAGGKTGFTAVVVAGLFLLALFFSPLAGAIPAYATAPALIFVGGLMMRELANIHWDDITETVPAALTAVMMPFTYSIATGLAFGFISYVAIKACTGRAREIHPATAIVAVLFVLKYTVFA